jgi:DNA-binding response OmpR family regulator
MSRSGNWKLLLVEDDRDSAEALMSLFDLHQIETLWSVDGPGALRTLAALEQVGERPPDAALLDLNLPNTDTVQLGRELRFHAVGCPVVLVSASSSQLLQQTANDIGAVAALRKPFSMESLVEVLRRHVPLEDGGAIRRLEARS